MTDSCYFLRAITEDTGSDGYLGQLLLRCCQGSAADAGKRCHLNWSCCFSSEDGFASVLYLAWISSCPWHAVRLWLGA